MRPAPACLIDASIYIFRYYFSLPPTWICAKTGFSTEAAYGYTGFLLKLLQEQNPPWVAACFDESLQSGFRHQLSPVYKSSRALPDEALAYQLNACREVTELLGVASFASEQYEADDLLASLSRVCRASGPEPVALLSRDKDLSQIIARPQDFLWDYSADKRHYPDDIERRFGVPPEQMADFQALVGDSSDDIAGVPGVGPKTAAALLTAAGSLDALLQNPGAVASYPIRGARSLGQKLIDYRAQILLARKLVTLVDIVPLIDHRRELVARSIQIEAFAEFSRSMGWPESFIARARTINQYRTMSA